MSPDRIIVGIEIEKIKEKFKILYKPFSISHEKLIFQTYFPALPDQLSEGA